MPISFRLLYQLRYLLLGICDYACWRGHINQVRIPEPFGYIFCTLELEHVIGNFVSSLTSLIPFWLLQRTIYELYE